jgi:hypothetical protein
METSAPRLATVHTLSRFFSRFDSPFLSQVSPSNNLDGADATGRMIISSEMMSRGAHLLLLHLCCGMRLAYLPYVRDQRHAARSVSLGSLGPATQPQHSDTSSWSLKIIFTWDKRVLTIRIWLMCTPCVSICRSWQSRYLQNSE